MSRDSMLTAIRRGLRRGPLPADQVAMLRGRLASHPRHLIPARSRLPHPDQIDLFVRNVEKEFGSVVRVPDAAAIPGVVADYLAAQNLPQDARFRTGDYLHRDGLRPAPGTVARLVG